MGETLLQQRSRLLVVSAPFRYITQKMQRYGNGSLICQCLEEGQASLVKGASPHVVALQSGQHSSGVEGPGLQRQRQPLAVCQACFQPPPSFTEMAMCRPEV